MSRPTLSRMVSLLISASLVMLQQIFFWASWAGAFTIRPSLVPPLAAAGRCSGPLYRMTGVLRTICVHSDGRVGIQLDKTAFEPRIGLAWKPFGSQTTAIRAGYAIFHDSSWNQGAQGLWENVPYFAESSNFAGAPGGIPLVCPLGNTTINCGIQRIFLQTSLQPITAPLDPSQFPGTVQSQNLNFKQGKVQQFNLNVERQIPGNVVL